jgi:hypothetical protein
MNTTIRRLQQEWEDVFVPTSIVTTLALGSQLKQGHEKVRAENVTRESHLHF